MSGNIDNAFDNLLTKIAGKISGEIVIEKLGKNLGIDISDIIRFNNDNAGGSSFVGTLKMLRVWSGNQNPEEAKKILKAALKKSDLSRLADIIDLPAPADNSGPEIRIPRDEVKKSFKVEMTKATPSDEQLDPNKNYIMDVSVTKGHMFIVNMSEARVGSHLDVGKIEYAFEEIGFKTKTCLDLTAKKFEDELEKFVTSPKHEGMCSAVFVIMAHGNETGIQCNDKQIVTRKFIMDKVNTMKHMNGKPKIIFFQCCRGGEELKKLEMDKAGTDVPAKSDVLRVYATTDGNGAYRDEDHGTWFIQMLCDELLENAHVSDLCTMLEQVTGKVAKMDSGGNGQCVEVVKQGISKKIYLLPKYSKE